LRNRLQDQKLGGFVGLYARELSNFLKRVGRANVDQAGQSGYIFRLVMLA
jgi:hypothetical protein